MFQKTSPVVPVPVKNYPRFHFAFRPFAILLSVPFTIVSVTFCVQSVEAQVVYSLGVQELYDDNLFLEDDNGTPPPFVLDDQLLSGEPLPLPPKQANGDPDDDFITNVYAGASGAIPLSTHLKTSGEARLGALLFADDSDENRFTVDALFSSETKSTLLPDPFYASTSAALQSRANDITVADGTATRQAETLLADFTTGIRDIPLSQKTKLGALYKFAYVDFLGNFTFGDDDEDSAEEFQNRFRERGADYFTNSVDTNLSHDFTDRIKGTTYLGVTDYVFTKVQSTDLNDTTEDELDRVEARTGVGVTYKLSEKFEATGNVGVNASHLKDKPEDITAEVIGDDGTSTIVTQEIDRDTVSLTFGSSISYLPEKISFVRLGIEQGVRTDIDGERILTRTFSLDSAKAIGDRLKLSAGGRFLQFNIGDELSNPTERYEFTVSASYSITEFIALVSGWNYANQSADEDSVDQLLYGSEDYEVNRFFIGLSGGLVGLKG